MKDLVGNCFLCGEHSLHIAGVEESQVMQCISCGYATSTRYLTKKQDENDEYKKLSKEMKKWSKWENNRTWIPTIMTLPFGMLYPIDVENEMKWAFAPMVDILEEEQKNYPDGNGGFFKQRYDNDNQTTFDEFVDSMLFLTNVGKDAVDG